MHGTKTPKRSNLRFLQLGRAILLALLFTLSCGFAGLLLFELLPPLPAFIAVLICALILGFKTSLRTSLSLLLLAALPCKDRTSEIIGLAQEAIGRAKAHLAIELGKDVPAFNTIFALSMPDWRWTPSVRVLRNHQIESSHADERRIALCQAEILRVLSEQFSRPELAKASYLLAMEEITILDPILTSHDIIWAHARSASVQ